MENNSFQVLYMSEKWCFTFVNVYIYMCMTLRLEQWDGVD